MADQPQASQPSQPTKLKLGLDGASVAIKIRNKTYNLTAPILKVSPGGSFQPGDLTLIPFRYKEDFDDAIDMGTPAELLDELYIQFVPQQLRQAPTPQVKRFFEQWQSIAQALKEAPILGSAINTFIKTNVRIVEIVLELSKQPDPPPTNPPSTPAPTYNGKFRFGLMFRPDPGARPRVFNIEIVAFGAVLWLELEGTVTVNK
ncbi:MAG: hypothetical protein ICV60_19295 [Pyrinomonadaceae bacterium]|nr:hypothetical protein [Pyrinomonadaceae bacterium]